MSSARTAVPQRRLSGQLRQLPSATIGHATLVFPDQTEDIEIGYLLQKSS